MIREPAVRDRLDGSCTSADLGLLVALADSPAGLLEPHDARASAESFSARHAQYRVAILLGGFGQLVVVRHHDDSGGQVSLLP